MILGIDLGTTNSLVGILDSGFPILLADADGERLTPSVVHFPEDGEPLVGRPASRFRSAQPARTVYSVKRFIGRRYAELTDEDRTLGYAISSTPDGGVEFLLSDGTAVTPEQVSASILRRLRSIAHARLEVDVVKAVITVPAYFNDAQRAATKRAGELAGLEVLRILNEPTAAALAYGLDKLTERSKIAVYDFGGGTFDISLLELHDGVFQVRATNGNTRLGGDDIDHVLVAHLLEQFALENPDAIILSRLREAATVAKHRLSDATQTTIDLPFLDGARSFSCVLTRAALDVLARPWVERTRNHCLRALADAQWTPGDLDAVVLVGGSTRMPIVREFVGALFGQPPDTSQNPDEAVALGATIQAGILAGAVRDVLLLDVTPLSLGIETFGGLMNVLIPRNTTIPAKAGEMFTNAVANQSSMRIRVLQGEREMARDNWDLGQFDLAFTPAAKGQARVGVQFEIDANGILHVLARDTQTGLEQIVTLRSAVDVSEEKVEQMVAESVEHAFDDMSERILAEARLKSVEMLPAVRNALALVGDQLDDGERAQIAELARHVEAALEHGNAQKLKRANTALDEGTQALAALLVERAMQQSLERKGLV